MQPEITMRPVLLRDGSASSTRTTRNGLRVRSGLGPRRCPSAALGKRGDGKAATVADLLVSMRLAAIAAFGGCSQSAKRYKVAETACEEIMVRMVVSQGVSWADSHQNGVSYQADG
jgi:hypothetical protein